MPFYQKLAHVYLVEWRTKEYHSLLLISNVPVSPFLLDGFRKENKSVKYALKKPTDSLDEIIVNLKDDGSDGAYG